MSGALPGTASAARAAAERWLAHLRRDERGLPVPWINRWGAESAASTRVAHDPAVGRLAVFHDDHGEVPDFTRQSMGRQRMAMMGGLCQVCGRATPWSRRNLIVSSVSCDTVTVDDPLVPGGRREAVAVVEPWLDDRCAAISTRLCPALIRREHADDLHVVPVRSHRDAVPVVSVGGLDTAVLAGEHLAPYAQHRGLALWVKAVLTHQQILVRDAAPTR